MSDLSWFERLHHIRFSSMMLAIEKWFSIFVLCFLILAGVGPISMAAFVVVFLVLYCHVHVNHYELLEGAGLPTVRWRF